MTYDLRNKTFGHLTVLEKLQNKNIVGKTLWKCLCICGDLRIAHTHELTRHLKGLTTCGDCKWHIKHSEAYNSWQSLKQRCTNINSKDYVRYGGRGITYDKRWEDFINFYLDMGDPPKDFYGERKSIDRKDNNGNYTKDNCKWSDRYEQQANKQ
jgi:hypothetical protein